MSNTLTLHVKKKYFDQIKSGEKTEEYRNVNPYWTKRLHGKIFDKILIIWRYPAKSDYNETNTIEFPWNGYELKTIEHEQFGLGLVNVFAIKLRKR